MPKYLTQSVHSPDGLKGVIKEGGTARREAVTKVIEAMGGKVEAVYFAFGATDAFMIIDMPDNVTAAAMSMIATASGASRVAITVLITPEELDQAAQMAQKMTPVYRPPQA